MLTAAVGFLLATPVAGGAVGPELYAGGSGNQTAPSISGSHLAYLDDSSGAPRVYYKPLDPTKVGTPALDPITALDPTIAHGPPRLFGTYFVYRVPGTVVLFDASAGTQADTFAAPGTGRTALTASFVAWEQEAADGGDVGWQRFAVNPPQPPPVVLTHAGRQRGIAAAVEWLAYINTDGVGSVHVVDTRDGSDLLVYTGAAREVSIWAGDDTTLPIVAVTVDGAAGVEILVFDLNVASNVDPPSPVARLGGIGSERVNPRLSGSWVGFEEVVREPQTGVVLSSLVTLWDRRGTTQYMPAPRGSLQELNDLIASSDSVVVAWADDIEGTFDIYLQTISLTNGVPTDPGPTSARCDDPAATVLADFTVVKDECGHPHHGCVHDGHGAHQEDPDRHHEGHDGDCGPSHHHGRRGLDRHSAGGALFVADGPTPVLVCIDATGVTSAWVAAGSQVVASPADFHGGTAKLEARLLVAAGDGRAGAVVAGNPGASLRVRVLADPGGNGNGSTDGSTCLARGDCPPLPRKLERASTFGCGTAGDAGSIGLLLLAGLFGVGRTGRRARR